MPELLDFAQHPPLHQPVLIVGLEGWIDAGMAAAGAMAALLGAHDHELVASYDTDVLLDHRSRRPMLSIQAGVTERLAWPAIELRAMTDSAGHHVLLLAGAEPDHLWTSFTDQTIRAALDFDVRMIVSMGAYPAAVPHTRDTRLSLTSPSEELLRSFTGYTRGTVDVPAGIQSSIEVAAGAAGIQTVGLWAQVPHYISGMQYPAGSIALLDHVNCIAGLALDGGDLPGEAATTREHLDALIADNDQHQAMIAQLELIYDESDPVDFGPLPTGDELAAELQAFLRDQGDLG